VDEQATFLFADLAGFTALTEAHGNEAAADLAGNFARRVTHWLPEFGEGSAKLIGDAIMARVPRAGSAVQLGLAIVERTADSPGYPLVRVGMSTGMAAARGGDYFGAAVNLAARVADQAAAGEVLLTESTFQAARGSGGGVQFRALGEQKFRNVSKPVMVYRATRSDAIRVPTAVDPVCRMVLREGQPSYPATSGGREYRFCSEECAERFLRDPAAFGA
jgi:adenylate cyclase